MAAAAAADTLKMIKEEIKVAMAAVTRVAAMEKAGEKDEKIKGRGGTKREATVKINMEGEIREVVMDNKVVAVDTGKVVNNIKAVGGQMRGATEVETKVVVTDKTKVAMEVVIKAVAMDKIKVAMAVAISLEVAQNMATVVAEVMTTMQLMLFATRSSMAIMEMMKAECLVRP